jgi:hypothetical protein
MLQKSATPSLPLQQAQEQNEEFRPSAPVGVWVGADAEILLNGGFRLQVGPLGSANINNHLTTGVDPKLPFESQKLNV